MVSRSIGKFLNMEFSSQSLPFSKTEHGDSTMSFKPAATLAAEIEEGNHEYKFKLSNMNDAQINHRITQLQWRLNEGGNEAVYHIGVEDDGNPLGLSEEDMQESLKTLQFMADQADCEMIVSQLFAGEQGITAEVIMRRRERPTLDTNQLTITLAGDVDSGKSTLIGVLCSGQNDNGRGLARTRVFTHNHEVESGRTSCISHHILNFGKDGEILNADNNSGYVKSNRLRALSDLELAELTSRTISLIDLAGHSKYLKTTLHGIVGRKPDYCIICISAVEGITSMTAEHISLGIYLNVKLIILITKIDLIVPQKNKLTYDQLGSVPALQKIITAVDELFDRSSREVMLISSPERLVDFLSPQDTPTPSASGKNGCEHPSLIPQKIKKQVPLFFVSTVNAEGLGLLRSFLYQLPYPKHTKPLFPSTSIASANGPDDASTTADERKSSQAAVQAEGNYIRILGSIGRTADEDGDDDADYDNQDLPTNEPTFQQPHASIAQYSGYTSNASPAQLSRVGSLAEYLNNSTATNFSLSLPTDDNDLVAYQLLQTQYLQSLAEFSHFVDQQEGSGSNSSAKILIGKVLHGRLAIGDQLLLGPTLVGGFVPVSIASVRLNNVPVRYAAMGQTATFRLVRATMATVMEHRSMIATAAEKKNPPSPPGADGIALNNNHTAKKRSSSVGLVLLSPSLQPRACREFSAEVHIVNHPSSVRVGYEPVVHIGSVRQSAKVVAVERVGHIWSREVSAGLTSPHEVLFAAIHAVPTVNTNAASKVDIQEVSIASSSTDGVVHGVVETLTIPVMELCNGERGQCRFRFKYYPEYIGVGEAIVLREDRIRGMGTVTAITPLEDSIIIPE